MIAIRRGWFHLASGAGLGRIFGFVSNLLLSRWLGPSDLGLFNLVTTTVQTSDTLVRCGGDYALNFELGGEPQSVHSAPGASLVSALSQLCSLATAFLCIITACWVFLGNGLFPIPIAGGQRIIYTALLLLMILCEGSSAPAWEVLLVSHRTGSLALRQGLFFPLRLLSAAIGALFSGVLGAMLGWTLIALLQCFWLKIVLGDLWKPFTLWPPLTKSLSQLVSRGFPFYAANLLASITFYPLLLQLASGSGLSDIGYLRVGQILQQLFAFLPATLVPVLFLKLRAQSSFTDQVLALEKPLRIIWLLLLQVLLLYCTFDQTLLALLFGSEFTAAFVSTRILLITGLFECLSQLVVQPLLANGRTRVYGFWQNGAALFSVVIGWLWIPTAGIAGYLIVRLLYVTIPLIGFGFPVFHILKQPQSFLSLALVSIGLLLVFVGQAFSNDALYSPIVYSISFLVVGFAQRDDLIYLTSLLRRNN